MRVVKFVSIPQAIADVEAHLEGGGAMAGSTGCDCRRTARKTGRAEPYYKP